MQLMIDLGAGTLITMSATPYNGILDPIYLRLENPDGILRQTSDSSMLLEALLDIGTSRSSLSLGCKVVNLLLDYVLSRGHCNRNQSSV
jgi:hypothetical protein